jgi:hypothetical protein
MTFDDFEDDEQEFQKPVVRKSTREDEDLPTLRKRTVASPSQVTDEDDEEDIPPAKVRKIVRSGWAGVEQTKVVDSAYASRLTVTDDPQIIKFVEDAPFASWRQHWIERTGQKSFVCLGEDCPLCNAGNKPSSRFAFNIALLAEGEEPVLKSFEIGPRVIDQLKNFHTDPRTGPLSKHYWAISKTGKGATTATSHQLVKDRDLEDFDHVSADDSFVDI